MTKPLKPEIRAYIERRLEAGTGPRAIARGLGIHRTTVQRINRARKDQYKVKLLIGAATGLPLTPPPKPTMTQEQTDIVCDMRARRHGWGRYSTSKPSPAPVWHYLKVAAIGTSLGLIAALLLALNSH